MIDMKAVVTTGVGDFEKLEFTDVPVPELDRGDILLRVLAAGVNNTDINTRLGWYASSVTSGTTETDEFRQDGGWKGASPFPLIQGTDCCGTVVAVGEQVDVAMIGSRVLV